VQEFKSFDVYFGKLNDYRLAHGLPADTDGLPTNASNPSLDGTTQVAPFHLSTVCIENDSPGWNESRRDINRYNPDAKTGPLDGFVYTAGHYALDENASGSPHVFTDVQGLRAIGYYTEREIPYYYFLATQFAISDRFFGTILSRTPPNRIANFAASALGVVNQAPTGAVFSQKTIFHLLDEAGITWKIYQNQGTYLGYFQPFYNNHKDHIASIDQYFTDLKNGTLPQVAYIEPQNTTNEHPGTNVQNGAAHVADLIDALMKSSAWKDSAFFLSYDHGGLYDHVLPQPTVNPDNIPPQLDPTHRVDDYSRTGFRVPLMVVSPFARKGYVSHTVMDQTAVLKFIEKRFDLPTLTARDAAQPDMTEFLDLTNVPNQSAPTPPVQPTDGPCTLNKLP
jgi:phospholipase C